MRPVPQRYVSLARRLTWGISGAAAAHSGWAVQHQRPAGWQQHLLAQLQQHFCSRQCAAGSQLCSGICQLSGASPRFQFGCCAVYQATFKLAKAAACEHAACETTAHSGTAPRTVCWACQLASSGAVQAWCGCVCRGLACSRAALARPAILRCGSFLCSHTALCSADSTRYMDSWTLQQCSSWGACI